MHSYIAFTYKLNSVAPPGSYCFMYSCLYLHALWNVDVMFTSQNMHCLEYSWSFIPAPLSLSLSLLLDWLWNTKRATPSVWKTLQGSKQTNSFHTINNPHHSPMNRVHVLVSFQGNNKRTINFLVVPRNRNGYLNFDQVFECAKDKKINPGLRKCYVELILVMFVDVDDNRPFLDYLCYSFVSLHYCSVTVLL